MTNNLISLPDGSVCREDLMTRRYRRLKFDSVGPGKQDKAWQTPQRFDKDSFDRRTPCEKDRDRFKYSDYLQRLGGVTQVVTPPADGVGLHSRLWHSEKVANLAGSIAADLTRQQKDNTDVRECLTELGGLDISACVAAGLAHDIGHPPYGHLAESAIDTWLMAGDNRCKNGFEGNAQSFRTVIRLDFTDPDSRALELTAVTLSAILKYPWIRTFGNQQQQTKFGAYHADEEEFNSVREWFVTANPDHPTMQTLEAAIMDMADDITYALHDLQDFISEGLVDTATVSDTLQRAKKIHDQKLGVGDAPEGGTEGPKQVEGEVSQSISGAKNSFPVGVEVFLTLADKLARKYPAYFLPKLYSEALAYVSGNLVPALDNGAGRDVDRSADIRKFVSATIGSLLDSVELKPRPIWDGGPPIALNQKNWHTVQILKEITREYVINSPRVGLHQESQRDLIFELLERLEKWARRENARALPVRLQSLIALNQEHALKIESSPSPLNFSDDPIARAIADYCCTMTDREAGSLSLKLRGQGSSPTIIL